MTYREYLIIALPLMLSTLTQPLLGAVDTAVVGRLGDPSYIGGVAIGTVVFNTMYWIFGFLRVSTSGFSAQSLGTGTSEDKVMSYLRPLLIAIVISLFVLGLQSVIGYAVTAVYKPEAQVLESYRDYYRVLIWGAPCVLTGYVNLGWLLGRKCVKDVVWLQVSTNGLNIVLDILFVAGYGLGVEGVAWATLIAQIYGLFVSFILIGRHIGISEVSGVLSEFINVQSFRKIFGVNLDLIVRTACLLIMTNLFVAKGSHLGVEVLAANAILFQIQYLLCYLYDGLANASSILVGESIGQNNENLYFRVSRISSNCTTALGVLLVGMLIILGDYIIAQFTTSIPVIEICREYLFWLYFFPLIIGHGLVYYGFYIGATYTRPIRNSLLVSLGVFILLYYTVVPVFGNNGLWFAFILFSLFRTVSLRIWKNGISRLYLS